MSPKSIPRLHAVLAILVWTLWYLWGGGAEAFRCIAEHWPVTLTMVFGSFIAGATAEGGGAVAFPVFTKVLHIAPGDARIFSLAIQSVGMTSAALTILIGRIPIDWAVLRWGSLGGLVGLILGALFVVPLVSAPVTRMVFTVMQASFAVALAVLNRGERRRHERIPAEGTRERTVLLVAGAMGGMATALVGTGLDILVFSVVVLLFRLSEKVATPTSVVLMAGNSIAGFALYAFAFDGFTAEIRDWWLAAVPVVVVGAPLGALVCSRLPRLLIARMLIGLIAVEVVTSLILVPLGPANLAASAMALVLFGAAYTWMYRRRDYEPAAA